MSADQPQPAVPSKADLLADLESRQDEVLRMLAELEERTLRALAQLSPQPTNAPAATDGKTEPAATPAVAAPTPSRKRAA